MRDLFVLCRKSPVENTFHHTNVHVAHTVCIKLVCYYTNTCTFVCLYLTQLFSATHLSEALLSRECVRIGWLASAAKGRLGAPYFSWEKSEGCSVRPLLHSHSPFTRHRDIALLELLLRAEPPSPQRAEGTGQLFFDCTETGWAAAREGASGKMGAGQEEEGVYQDGVPPALTLDGLTGQSWSCSPITAHTGIPLFIMFYTFHESEPACP